jgi:hypothetical protein
VSISCTILLPWTPRPRDPPEIWAPTPTEAQESIRAREARVAMLAVMVQPWPVAPLEPPGAFVERQRCWQASACLEPTRQEGSKRRPVEGLVGLRWSRLRWALMGSRAGIDQRSCPMEMVSPMPSGMEMRPPVFSIDRWWLHPHAYPWRGPDLSEGWEPRAEDRTSLA